METSERFIDETNYRLVNQKTIDLLVKEAKVKIIIFEKIAK